MHHPDQREIDVRAREAQIDARELSIRASAEADAGHERATQCLLDDAAARDHRADLRDGRADARDRAASLDAFLLEADGSEGMRARRVAALDRLDAKADRASAAEDRARLRSRGRLPG